MKRAIYSFTLGAVLSLSFGGLATASIEDDLQSFVDDLGGGSNVTDPSMHQGQGYQYFNGGRLYTRVPSRTFRLASLKLPNYKAGCGGIDVFGGGFSFIDADEFVETVKTVGSEATGYLFLLALRTISSHLGTTVQQIIDWMIKINSGNYSTCELAAGIAGSVGGMVAGEQQTFEQSTCIMQRMETSADDYTEARGKCTSTDNERNSTNANPDAQKQAFIHGNLVWQIMVKNEILKDDNEMRELLMSITGTIVKRKVKQDGSPGDGSEDDSSAVDFHAPLGLSNDDLLDAILKGGTIELYRCGTVPGSSEEQYGEGGCTHVFTDNDANISPNKGLERQVQEGMDALFAHYKTKSPDEPSEEALRIVRATGLPVLRFVKVAAGLRGNSGEGLYDKYVQVVAANILHLYLGRLLDVLQGHIANSQYGSEGKAMLENIKLVRSRWDDRHDEVVRKVVDLTFMYEEIKSYERLMLANLPASVAKNYHYVGINGS